MARSDKYGDERLAVIAKNKEKKLARLRRKKRSIKAKNKLAKKLA